ncbi:MAG: putative toxin-antitoxin system toxin component, PIN family [Chitinivibrionia bacterium]|nr:putative toxin-antitoxin system toxin component, PIN family [Chitinivibrionia bacterium]
MLNYKLVIDTNVFVSSLLKSPSIPSIIVDTVFKRGDIVVVYSDDMLLEYIDVLNRKKLKIPPITVNTLLSAILKNGEKVSPFPQYVHFSDESDKKFYETFKTANADYLITGNLDDFPQEEGIISPRRFAEILDIQI